MSNKNGSLEAVIGEGIDYNLNELEEIGEVPNFTTVFTVDFVNKRRVKDSIPSLILKEIEGKRRTAKEIENALFRRKNKAITKAREKLGEGKDFREYLRRRITAVFRYYLNEGVIEELGARVLLREVSEGKAYFSLYRRFIPAK